MTDKQQNKRDSSMQTENHNLVAPSAVTINDNYKGASE